MEAIRAILRAAQNLLEVEAAGMVKIVTFMGCKRVNVTNVLP